MSRDRKPVAEDFRWAALIGKATICLIAVLFAYQVLVMGLVRMPEAQTRATVSRARADMRMLGAAVESYHQAKGAWPAAVPLVVGLSHAEAIKIGATTLSTFTGIGDAEMIKDPFSPKKRLAYACFAEGERWAIWSPGPDAHYDLQPEDFRATGFDQENRRIVDKLYDPTNGSYSNGDVLRVSEAKP